MVLARGSDRESMPGSFNHFQGDALDNIGVDSRADHVGDQAHAHTIPSADIYTSRISSSSLRLSWSCRRSDTILRMILTS